MSAAPGRARPSRALFFSIYGIVVLAGVAVLNSVLRDLYARPPAETAAAGEPTRAWCVRRLAAQRLDLEHQITFELERPSPEGDPLARYRGWRERWDKQLDPVRERCAGDPAMQQLIAELEAVQATYSQSVEALTVTRTGASRRLEQALRDFR